MKNQFSARRRRVIRAGALGAFGVALGDKGFAQEASAEKVDPSSPLAQSLHYVEDAAKAPADLREQNEYCHNCQYYQSEQQTGEAACTIFMGMLVPAEAWCNVWIMKGGTPQ